MRQPLVVSTQKNLRIPRRPARTIPGWFSLPVFLGLLRFILYIAAMSEDPDKLREKKAPPPLEEGDFYMEDGLMVLTESYHKKRGYCCESGCRHCPYGFKKGDD